MNITDAPKKQPVPFAVNGQRENLLPSTPAGDNTASYSDGFPPVTMILKAAGGLPPKGQDINQILYELSSLARWSSAGALNTFDSFFSESIGGYPKGAMILGNDGISIYQSTIDNNGNNPNSSSTGWRNLSAQYLARQNPFSDIKADGTVSTALENLGLGDGTSLPVGTPIPWPTSTPPKGWITMSGQTITSPQYPTLFALYGSKLPDLRGQFIRGWANDGQLDSGRALLSSQGDAIRNITGTATPTAGPGLSFLQTTAFQGALTAATITTIQPLTGFGPSSASQPTGIYLDASRTVPTANENRPSNIAFNYIVRGI